MCGENMGPWNSDVGVPKRASIQKSISSHGALCVRGGVCAETFLIFSIESLTLIAMLRTKTIQIVTWNPEYMLLEWGIETETSLVLTYRSQDTLEVRIVICRSQLYEGLG